MIEFLDGTVTYIPECCSRYRLRAVFSEGAQVRVMNLHRLQQMYHGSLTLTYGEQVPSISLQIVAHGPESACKQADDLVKAISRKLGLRVNLAHPLRPPLRLIN